MAKVVGVAFRKSGRVYYFDPDIYKLSEGDRVVVETIRGLEIGKIIFTEREINLIPNLEPELKKIVRPATNEDLISLYQKRIMSKRALKICKNKIKEYNLEMKLVDVEYAFDDSKIIFYFSADGRIDFRNLVKELAVIFKKRIELHQIGVRDEAKILGAVGLCGRPVCCSLFMPEFVPVSIKMAKEQNLSLNPERISGVCGRFMCCLKHEHDVYHEGLDTYPPIGSFVNTDKGKLKVLEQCISKDSVICETLEQERIEIPLKKIPEYAHVVEANTTPNFEVKPKKIDNIDIKETSVKEANLLAREAINLLSNFGIGNVISSDDLDKDEEEANKTEVKEPEVNEKEVIEKEVNEKEQEISEENIKDKVEIKETEKEEDIPSPAPMPIKKEKFRILIPKDMIKTNLSSSTSENQNKEKVKKVSKIKISPTLSKEIFAGTWNGTSSNITESNQNEENKKIAEEIKEPEEVIQEEIEQEKEEAPIQNQEDILVDDKIDDKVDTDDNEEEVITPEEDEDEKEEDKEDIETSQTVETEIKQEVPKKEHRFEKRGFIPRNPYLSRRNFKNNRNERNDRREKYDRRDSDRNEKNKHSEKSDHRERTYERRDNNNRNSKNNHNEHYEKNDRRENKNSKPKKFWSNNKKRENS
ncbi:stage 0 sporulation family protein [bacterium]|nr:stage 0 sporulation family protein [bacterium]